MRRIFYLSTCDTCRRILKIWAPSREITLQDIKYEAVTPELLQALVSLAGSHEAVFSRKAVRYRELKLGDKQLTEDEMRNYILSDYTFLRRPILVLDKLIWVGNNPATIESARKALELL